MKYLIIAGIMIIALFLTVMYFIPRGIEPLTEVYIENHTSLPINVYLNKTYEFDFTVHNLEYQDMKYDYTITKYDENGTLMEEIGMGSVILANDEYKTIGQEYRFDSPFDRAQIKVLIKKDDLGIVPDFKKGLWWPDPNYPTEIDVHFWVDEIVQTKIIIIED